MPDEEKPIQPVQTTEPVVASTVVTNPNPDAIISTQQQIILQVRNDAELDSISHKIPKGKPKE